MKHIALLAGLLTAAQAFAQSTTPNRVPEPEMLALVGVAAVAGIAAVWFRKRK